MFEQPKIEYSIRSINSLIKAITVCRNKYPVIKIKTIIVDDQSKKDNLDKIRKLIQDQNIEIIPLWIIAWSATRFTVPSPPHATTIWLFLKALALILDVSFAFFGKKMSGLLSPDVQETITGTAQILEIFKVSGAGKVAGSKITEGEINSNSDVRIIRDGAIIYTGKVSTIFREKNQVKQVSDGQECGITVKDYMDFQKNDTIEAFSVTSTERSI